METKHKELYSLHFLRCIAVILITWDHLLPGMYLENIGSIPVSFVERFILWPMSIINYFGFFGVVIFFLISGYAGMLAFDQKRPSMGAFALKRVFRILPPAVFSLVGYYLVFYVLYGILMHGALPTVPTPYLQANGALWTLKVEILFYIIFAAAIPLFRKDLHLGVVAATAVVVLLCEGGRHFEQMRALSDACSYCFYILFGAYFYLIRKDGEKTQAEKIFAVCFLPLLWYLVVHYNIVVYNPERYETGNSYGVSFLYAMLLFLVFLSNEDRLPQWRSTKLISRYSYSVYLNQVPMRAVFAPIFALGMPTPLLSGLALVFTILLSWVYEQFVDPRVVWLSKKILSLGRRKE